MNTSNPNDFVDNFYSQEHSVTPICEIFNMKISQKTIINTNFVLQIIGIKQLEKLASKQDAEKTNVFCLNLSDNQFFLNGFLAWEQNSCELNLFDILEINCINIIPKANQKLFILKDFRIIGNSDRIIGHPQNIAKLASAEHDDIGQGIINDSHKNNLNIRNVNESNNFPQSNYLNNNQNSFYNKSHNRNSKNNVTNMDSDFNSADETYQIDLVESDQENFTNYDRKENNINNYSIPSRNQRITIPSNNINFMKNKNLMNNSNGNNFTQGVDMRKGNLDFQGQNIDDHTSSNSNNYISKKRLREGEIHNYSNTKQDNSEIFLNQNLKNVKNPITNNSTSLNDFIEPRPTKKNCSKTNVPNQSSNPSIKENPILTLSSSKSSNSQPVNYIPLNHLTTFSKDFTILVRIIKKSSIKNFNINSNSSRPGRLFNLNIMDCEKSEMQITCFNRGVDKFYDFVEENKVYSIYGGYIKLNDRKFYSGANKSEYKLVLDENCIIKEMPDDGTIDSNANFSLLKISNIFDVSLYSVVDLCVFVLECGETQLKSTKNGDLFLRKLIVCDDSECKVELTLWRTHAQIDLNRGQFLLIKNAKVGEFNGRNFTSFDDTIIVVNPENSKEIEQLKIFIENFQGEYKNVSILDKNSNNASNGNESMNSHGGKVYFMQEILDMIELGSENNDGLGANSNVNMKKIKGTITQMIHNDRNFYAGCPDTACKRKMIYNDENEEWICHYCSKTLRSPAYYYNLSLRVKDCSCEHWIDLFGSNAEKILKISAEEYRNVLLTNDSDKLREINKNIEFKTFYFTVKAKIQQFNGNLKKKIYAYKFEEVNDIIESKRLIDKLMKEIDTNANKDNSNISNNSNNFSRGNFKNNINGYPRNVNVNNNNTNLNRDYIYSGNFQNNISYNYHKNEDFSRIKQDFEH